MDTVFSNKNKILKPNEIYLDGAKILASCVLINSGAPSMVKEYHENTEEALGCCGVV